MIYEIKFKKNAKIFSKTIKAKNLANAQEIAISQGLNIVNIQEKAQSFKLSLSNEDLILFFKELALLLEVGLSINLALNELENAFKGKKLGAAILSLKENLKLGLSLSAAFEASNFKLNLSEIALIKTAENTGEIAEIFTHISTLRNNLYQNQKRLKKALQYPLIVLFSLIFAFIFLMLYVVPNFKELFYNMGANLPLITQILLAIYEFLDENLSFLIFGILALIFTLFILYKNNLKFAFACDSLMLKIPIFSRLILYNQFYYFFMIFSLLLKSGLGLEKCVNLSFGGLSNLALKSKFESILKAIQNGVALDLAFKNSNLFDALSASMLSVAQKSAKLSTICFEIAKLYASRQDDIMSKLSTLIEPIMTLFVAILVLFLALAIFLPMWQLSASNV